MCVCEIIFVKNCCPPGKLFDKVFTANAGNS